jgi:putative sigma-54 modulation protein
MQDEPLSGRQQVQVNVSGRHSSISPEVRDYATDRAEHLQKFYDRITNVDVVIDHERDTHTVETVAHVEHGSALVAKHKGEGLMIVMDATFDKLERQVRKLKDRVRRRRPHHGARIQETPGAGESEETEFEEDIDIEEEF